ncbi:MAG: FadR family transcriptional regulator [Sandaracinaceae bacterium]|nr:FadR family transcriptional regulator [Sandaracinaceae bacterium]
MLRPITRQSIAASVFDQLRDHIVQGQLAPGDSLPSERVLAEQLGVNRGAVREGLKRLEQAGLVSIQQGETTQVRDFRRTAGLELLGTMLLRADGTIDTAVARSIVELRSELAPVIARLAVRRASEQHLDRVDAAVAAMRATSNLDELQHAALHFWTAVVDGTQNVALQLAMGSLSRSYGAVLSQLASVMAAEVRATEDYAALASALRGRREPSAVKRAQKIVALGADAVGGVIDAVSAFQGEAR